MQKIIKIISGLSLFILSSSIAWAVESQLPGMMTNFQSSATQINTKLFAPALITASAALSLQWIATHWKEIFSGDISSMFAKTVGVISWFGFSVFLLNNSSLLSDMFSGYLNFAGVLSGIGVDGFSPGNIISNGILIIGKTNDAFSVAADSSWWEMGDNMVAALMLSFANIFTFIAFLMISLSVFVAQMEFWVLFSVAPLAFALIPLSAFRDQGIAPIKGLISLGLRLIILGVIVSVTKTMTTTLVSQLEAGLPKGTAMYEPIWYYLAGMAGCAMMAMSAGKIASSIASGSASFSGTDAIKGGMQMATTAAAGAAVATAGVAAVGAATNAASKGAIGAASGAGRAVGAMSARGNLGISPAGGGGAPVIGGPLPTASGASGQALNSKSAGPSSGASAPSTSGDASTAGIGGGDSGSNNKGATPAASSGEGSSATSASPASSGGAQSAKVSGSSDSAAPGNASTAGIGGGNPTAPKEPSNGPSGMSKMGDAIHRAAESNAQDNQAVAVTINTRGD